MIKGDARFPPLKRERLFIEVLPSANPPVRLVRGARIKFAPRPPTGLHRHPMFTAGVVTQGSFTFQLEGEAARLLRAGHGFFGPAGRGTVADRDHLADRSPPGHGLS
jgi:quercetin dioxygenase-like cupin family protein